MSHDYQHLLAPGKIGNLQLRNRMIVSSMGVNLAEADGSCGERVLAYHERQAQGGAGLIMLGVTGVAWPHGGNLPRQIAISEDRHIPGLRAVADAVHQHGAKLAAQLHHGGMVSVQDAKEGRPIWMPAYPEMGQSDLADGMLPEEMTAFQDPDAPTPQPHIVTREDLQQLVQRFADAAGRAVEAGIDGLEIHGGHGYIISGFLSPSSNDRSDEYGGSLENRARLLLEIIAAVRERVGRNYPVWVKLDAGEYGKHGGISLADAIATAKMAEKAGVDAITVSAYHDTDRGALHSESNIPHVPERMVPDATAIKSQVSVPVIASGRIEPESASRHIGKQHFDFLGMGRKILADPALPAKLAAGTPERIRPCVYCYCCVSQIYVLNPVKCAVNPETARERERELIPVKQARHIAVVGGGPGGMEAARRLSLRGHQVTLVERSSRLGGTLQFAAIAYSPNARLLDWLRSEVTASTVDVQLNATVTPNYLRQLGVDEVVVATGARRDMPAIPGAEQDFVFSGDEMRSLVVGEAGPALRRKTSGTTRLLMQAGRATGLTARAAWVQRASKFWLPLGKQVVIVGGELVGLELAEFLAERGRKVTVIEPTANAGRGLYLVRRMRLLAELRELGVSLIKNSADVAIDDHAVSYTNHRGQRRSVVADHVIAAQGAAGDTTLADELSDEGFKVHSIGDCTGVSYIEGALESAAELAVALD
ncbi:MAG: FAD-dependent oxidoreductase [Halieaceae bacterium]|nr:FAD-dependent oxidoreductase [Halieaceae bacterium]